MKKLIIIISTLILTSCGSTYNLSTDYRIKSILTITEKGDTLAVPIRDFKFRVLDRRIRELIDRNSFRYQYRGNWQNWNYNSYPVQNYNQRYNYNNSKPNVQSNIKPANSRPPIIVKPYIPTNLPSANPIVKPNNNKNKRK